MEYMIWTGLFLAGFVYLAWGWPMMLTIIIVALDGETEGRMYLDNHWFMGRIRERAGLRQYWGRERREK